MMEQGTPSRARQLPGMAGGVGVWPPKGFGMTQNRRSKRAVRARMADTGEKYTEAQRALLAASDDGRGPSGDVHVARFGAVLDRLDAEQVGAEVDERLPACAGRALALLEALRPVVGITIRLGAGPPPGVDAGQDASWGAVVALARREVLARQAAGIDYGLAGDSLRLLDRIDRLTGEWPVDSWNDAVGSRVQELVQARQRGAQRGQELRDSRQETHPSNESMVGWLLRHPNDHWLRGAIRHVSDPECRASIQSLIAKLQPSYEQIGGLDLRAEEATAEVICEAEIVNVSPVPWKEPVSAVVTAVFKGDTASRRPIAIRLVQDPGAEFNGSLASLLTGERWRICARKLADGTLLPLDGTRRRAAASS